MLIALILFGVAVITVAAVALLRSSRATEARKARYLDPERGEREIYEKLYGKRSGTVSAPLPAEPPPKSRIAPALTRLTGWRRLLYWLVGELP